MEPENVGTEEEQFRESLKSVEQVTWREDVTAAQTKKVTSDCVWHI